MPRDGSFGGRFHVRHIEAAGVAESGGNGKTPPVSAQETDRKFGKSFPNFLGQATLIRIAVEACERTQIILSFLGWDYLPSRYLFAILPHVD